MRSLVARLLGLLLLSWLALQGYFLLRVVLITVVDPASTSFQRSEAWRLTGRQHAGWQHRWVPYERISIHLKRAVIASEDARFADHGGVEWEAVEKAWERNERAEARVEQRMRELERRGAAAPAVAAPKVVGGSTITQQLAKNLFLSGERSLGRKAQEFIIVMMLEAVLSKQRILEIYLNHVEWGEGVFGAEAAARRYFGVAASQLSPAAAARLAVMLPAPKRFEQRPASPYVAARAATLLQRMAGVEIP